MKLGCKECGNPLGNSRLLVQQVQDEYIGDHSEREIRGAGAYCSWDCLYRHAEARREKVRP